jgi:pimeloyl-ACP methyl ester carboxylesterase
VDEQVTALADRYHVIRYDQRGFGRSDHPREPYSPVADLDTVLDRARCRRC